MKTQYLTKRDMTVLFKRAFPGARGKPHVFVGHNQPTYSAYMVPLCEMMNGLGWNVHAADLRGHGNSVSKETPRAHLHPENGWDDLKNDMRFLLDASFENVPWEDRIIVVPNISALLTVALLKEDPDIAKTIVLMSPPPNQPSLARFGQAVIKARLLLHRPETADNYTMHHFRAFLSAHLKDAPHPAAIMSSDNDLLERVINDPNAWPVVSLGYWAAIFRGFSEAWKKPQGFKLREGTRVLVLYGEQDAMMRDGALVKTVQRWFEDVGVTDFSSRKIVGGRQAYYLDKCAGQTFEAIRDFVHRADEDGNTSLPNKPFKSYTSDILGAYSHSNAQDPMTKDELVEICYDGVNDEGRWVELLYRFVHDYELNPERADMNLDSQLKNLMPHWDRAFHLRQQVLDNAVMGVLVQEIIDRLDIGIAVVSDNFNVYKANENFRRIFTRVASKDGQDDGALSAFIRDSIRQAASGTEGVLVFQDRAIGYAFRPRALLQVALRRDGPSTIVVLRSPKADNDALLNSRAPLLELAYGLTSQEAAVALSLSDGISPELIGERLGISINTIRSHLKRCYEKVGVQSQNELSTTILRGPVGWLTSQSSSVADKTVSPSSIAG